MSGYSQQAAKRQKVRETKMDTEFFQGIDKIEFNNMASPNEVSSYRYYNATERIHNKTMEEWLKLSVSFTDFRNDGPDYNYTCSQTNTPWDDHTHTIDNHKRCVKALFEFISKLGLKYWTAFDTDLVPWSDSGEETRVHWDEMVDFITEMGQRYHVKLLWIAPDLHSHPRYGSGALTTNDATTFTRAASQIKKCLEISQKLNAECFLIWPYKEGYDTIFRTDVQKEIKLFAKLLKITSEYKDRLNYRCQLLIMPYYNSNFGRYFGSGWQHCLYERDLIKMYMWDVTSCLYLLKSYNLDRYYKVCSPPGHHMYMATVYNMLGGVIISNDVDQYDSKMMTLMMKCILDQGTTPPGGISLQMSTRRFAEPRARLTVHLKYVDAAARGLRCAVALATDQLFTKHLQQRYASYQSGFGSRLLNSDISIEECEEYYKKNHASHTDSSKCEQLDLTFQRYLDTSDHI